MDVRRRTLLVAPSLLGLSMIMEACSSSGHDSEEAQVAVNQSEAARIEKELASEIADVRRPSPPGHVSDLFVNYLDVFPDKGTVAVGMVLVRSELERLDDWAAVATGIVWRSRISPLRAINVWIGWGLPDGAQVDGQRKFTTLSGDTGRAELTAQYGPRPVADDS